MAKVMISLPDALLSRIDRRAKDRGTTRSGLLRDLAQEELERAGGRRQAHIDELLDPPGRYGGSSAAELRRLRLSR